MRKFNLENILQQIAYRNHTTTQHVRQEMELAMQSGLSNPEPAVQAEWASIPKKGAVLTLEEFLCYLAEEVNRQ